MATITEEAAALAEIIYEEMAQEYWSDTPLPADCEVETKRYYFTLAKALIRYMHRENS